MRDPTLIGTVTSQLLIHKANLASAANGKRRYGGVYESQQIVAPGFPAIGGAAYVNDVPRRGLVRVRQKHSRTIRRIDRDGKIASASIETARCRSDLLKGDGDSSDDPQS